MMMLLLPVPPLHNGATARRSSQNQNDGVLLLRESIWTAPSNARKALNDKVLAWLLDKGSSLLQEGCPQHYCADPVIMGCPFHLQERRLYICPCIIHVFASLGRKKFVSFIRVSLAEIT
jgi:hypothetical protein